ncbi:hypothetical protein BrevBR_15510 [Brevundimonas sp. BR2-1]|uniref:hypothetical protein n=1 Tax=Brevundimonas sp. BR2-1 TaxID=3031123 RepID=UPI0030998C2C
MKAKLEIMLEHPVMFLSDPYADDFAPLDIRDKSVAYAEGCIAVKVGAYFDGGADITISSEKHHSGDLSNFNGTIAIKSGVISVSDSGRFNYLMLPVGSSQVDVEVWNLHDDSVWIRISPLVEY